MKSSSWGFFFIDGVSANWSSKGGTKEHENTDFCQWILLKWCSEKTSFFVLPDPLYSLCTKHVQYRLLAQLMFIRAFYSRLSLLPIVRLVMMELYSLKRNSRRLLQHNHKLLLARPTCSQVDRPLKNKTSWTLVKMVRWCLRFISTILTICSDFAKTNNFGFPISLSKLLLKSCTEHNSNSYETFLSHL